MKISTAITNCKKTAIAFLAVLFCLIVKPEIGNAQTANQYTFSTNATSSLASAADLNGNAVDMTTGTTQLVAASQDDVSSSVTNIGFNFTFFGTTYTQFSASSNGGIRLGGTVISNTTIGTSFPVLTQAILAPYLQDIRTSTTGKVHYKLIGTAPNRTLVIEFLNMGINFNNATANGTFQVRLYEQTNIIEYVYGSMSVGSISATGSTAADARTAVIGFSNTTGINNEFSVNQSTYATTTAAAPITNTNNATGNIAGLNSASNGSRRAFIFTPALAYRAQFISMSTGSTTWCAGETRTVSVTVKNIGTATWTNSSPDINVGVKWNTNGTNWTDYHVRTDANNLAPGVTGTYNLTITASNATAGPTYSTPLAAGINNLTFDVVEETVSWFGDNGGNTGPGNSKFTSPNQTINATPTPTFTTSPTANTCSGVAVTYTTQVGQSNYVWTVPGTAGIDYTITSGGIGTTSNTVTLKWLTSGSKVVTVNYTTGSCSGLAVASNTTLVAISPTPTFTASPTANTCSGVAVTYTTQVGQSNYVWTVPGTAGIDYTITSGGIGTTSNTVTLKWLTSGSKVVTVNYTTGSCSGLAVASNTTLVAISPTPTFTASPTANTCSNTDVTYTTQVGQSNYLWTVPGTAGIDYTITAGGIGTTSNTVTLKWLTSGSKVVTVNYTTGSCSGLAVASNTTTVAISPTPTFTTSPTANTCSNTDVTYTTQAGQSNYLWTVPGTAGIDYTITAGGIGTTSNTVTLKWLTSGSKVVTVNYTTGSCSGLAVASNTTTVNLSPIVNAGGAIAAICQGGTTVSLGGSFGGGATSAIWDDGGAGGTFANNTGATPGTTTYTASASAPGSVTLTLTTSGGSCGIVTDSKTLTVYQSVAITSNPGPLYQKLCATGNVTYTVTATGSGPLTYQWLLNGNPVTNGGRISGATTSSLSITGLTLADQGTYSVLVSGLSPCTSATSDTAHLDVDQRITFTTQPATPQTVCELQPYTISASATGTIAIYEWYKNGLPYAAGTFDNVNTYTLTIPSVTPADAGSYRLFLDDGTGIGCTSVNSNIAVLNISVTSVGGSVSTDATVCSGTNSGTLSLSGQTGNVVRWESSTDNFVSVINPIANTSTSQNYTNLTQTTQYRAVVQSGVCPPDNSAAATITVYATPSASVAGSNQTICSTTASTILGANTPANGTGTWSVTSGPSTLATQFSNVNNPTATFTPAVTTAGTYVLAWTISNGPCATTASSLNIVVNTAATISGQPSNQTTCAGTAKTFTVTLSAGTTPTYQWQYSPDNITFTNVINATPANITYGGNTTATLTVTPAAAAVNGTYYYRCVVNVNGCSVVNSSSATLQVYATPSASVAGSNQTICSTTASTILGANTPANGTGTWSVTSGPSTLATQFSNVNNPTATFTPAVTTAGTYVLAWTISNGPCATTASSLNIVVNTAATISGQPSNQTTCAGTAKTFTVTLSAGTTPTYQWQYSPDNITFTNVINATPANITYGGNTTATLTVTPAAAAVNGTYYYRCVVNVNGCSVVNSSSATLQVYATPSASVAGSNQTICSTTASTILGANTPANGTGTWSVTSGPSTLATQFSNVNNPTATFTPAVTTAGTYVLAWTISNGPCATTASSLNIVVNTAATISGQPSNQTTCAGTAKTFTVTLSAGTTPTYQWQYSPDNITFTNVINATPANITYGGNTTATLTVTPAAAAVNGTYYYRCVVNVNGCSVVNSSSATLQVYATPSASVAGSNQTICSTTASTILGANTPANGTGTWSVTSGPSTLATQFSNVNNPTATFTPAVTTAGTYVLAWTISNGPCATTASSLNIVVNTAATISGQPSNQTTCAGTAKTFTVTLSAGTTPTYQWQYSPDNITFTNVINATPANITYGGNTTATLTVTPAAAAVNGTYYYRCVVNVNGCSVVNSNSATLQVYATPTTAAAGGNQTICTTSPSATLAANTPTNGTGTWSVSSGPSLLATQFSNVNSPTATFTAAGGAGTYTLVWTISNGPCTSSTSSVNIIVNAAPVISGQPVDQSTCAGTLKTFTVALSAGTSPTYQWQYFNGATWNNVVNGTPANITYTNQATATLTVTPAAAAANGTYSYRCVVNVNGCSVVNSNSATLQVYATPTTANAGADQTICTTTASTSLTANTPVNGSGTWSINSGPSVVLTQFSNVNSPTSTFTPAGGAGTYSLKWTISNGTCTASSDNVTITVNTAPVINSQPANQTTCAGTAKTFTVTLSAGTSPSYQWQYSAAAGGPWSNVANGTPANITYTNAATATLTVTPSAAAAAGTYYYRCVITVGGCSVINSNSATLTVNINSTISLSSVAGTDAQEICNNSPLTNITYTIGGGGTGASITSGALPAGVTGAYNSGTKVFTISGTPTASGTFIYTITTTGPCTQATASGTITVDALPSGTFTANEMSGTANNDGIICVGGPVSFTFSNSTYGSYIFKLDGNTVQTGTGNSYNTSSLIVGTHQVTVDIANSSNCGASFGPITITVNPLPTPTLGADKTSICAGDTVTFTAGGGANYNFKVNGSSVQSSSLTIYKSNTLNNGDTVTVDVTNANGCVASSSKITITVNALPVVSPITGTTSVCVGSTTALSSTPSGGVWNSSNTAVAMVNTSGVVTGASAGTSIISYTVTNASSCSTTVTTTVNVYALPTGSVTITENSGTANDSTICKGAGVKFTATATGTNYKFYLNGTGAPIQQGGTNFINITTLNDGDFITVLVTNGNNCSATFKSNKITVIDLPAGTLTASANPICAGDQVDFTATSGFTNYNFKRNGTSFQNGPSNMASYTGFLNGDNVTVTVSTVNSCSAIFNTVTITVNPLPTGTLVPVENSGVASNDSIICKGDSVVFTATPGFSNYNFKLNGITVKYSASNTYSTDTLNDGDVVTVEVTNVSGCIASFNTATITVYNLPVVAVITGNASVCVSDTIHLSDITAGGAWSSGNSTIATVNSSGVVTGVAAGTDTISYTVTNGNGCSRTVNKAITVNALPVVAAITGNFNICTNTYSQLSDDTTGGVWSSSNNAIATVDVNGLVEGVFQGTDTIFYTVTNANGCTTTVIAVVSVSLSPTVAPITTTAPSFDVCVGSSIPLKDATSSGAWSSSNTAVAMVNASGIVTGVAAGTADIYYVITTTCLSKDTAVQTVTVHALPTATINGSTAVCLGSSPGPDITFTGANGDAPYTFTYNINGGSNQTVTTASGNSVTVTAPTGTAGTFTYNLVSVKDGSITTCSQNQSGSATVTVNALPTATVSGTTSVCIASSFPNITFTGSGGTAPYIFSYNINGGPTLTVPSVGNIATVPVSTALAGTYTYNLLSVQEGSSNLCSGTASGSATVTVTPASVGGTVAPSSAPVCSGSNTGTITLSGQTGTVIRWEFSINGGTTWTTIANTTTSLTYTNLTQTTLYRAVVQSGTCSSANSSAATITVNPVSVGGTVASNATVCSGSNSGTLTLSGNTGSVIRWEKSIDGGTTWTTIANTTTSQTYTNLTQTTLYRAVVQSGVCSSANSAAATITVNPLPTATISGTANVCQNATAPIITFTGANGTAPYTFTYKINAGGNLTVGSGAGNTATVTQATGTIGTFTYTLVSVSSAAGCSQNQSGTVTITVNAPPAAFVLTPTSATICQGTIQPLSASGNTSSTGSVTIPSGNINLPIPDNSATGAVSTINVAGIPAGAVINSVSVNFNVPHQYDGDLVLNLKAPNGNRLNLVDTRGTGPNFTNTTISSTSINSLTNNGQPYTGTYSADATNGIGATGNVSNVTTFPSLYGTPNGNWSFSAEDVVGCHGGLCFLGIGNYYTGTLNNWSITINYTIPNSPLPVTWFPTTDLYTDPGATTAYTSTSLSTVYAKPSTSGTKIYTATVTNAANCTTSQNVTLTVNPTPVVTITADYCAVPGKVQLTANSVPAASSYLWSTGQTINPILVDVAGNYTVTVISALSCPGTATISVANELVVNGDFSGGNTGFTSDYAYKPDLPGLVPAGQGELYDDSGNNGYSITTNGQNVHIDFWGQDHTGTTSSPRNFMAVNGHGNTLVVWKETVNVLPNTKYYFSAWAMSLNSAGNNAQLQFSVNGTLTGTTAVLANHGESNGSPDNWTRFYGTWTSGPTTTSADIYINDLQAALGGNDFGIDDVSFGTLSTFVNLESAPGTDAQTICINTPITNIVYSYGNNSSNPSITGLPAGVSASFSGDELTISGTPTVAGNYTYNITTTGCQPYTVTGTITVQKQTITLTSGNASPTLCINTTLNPSIVYTVSGSGTGAIVKGLPAGLSGNYNAGTKTFTISGTPTIAGIFKDTVITSGTCKADTAYGTITVQNQTITLNAGSNAIQTVCVNTAIANITYTLGNTSGATVSGLPSGVSGSYSSGSYIISGTPIVSGTFNYTVTTLGTCNPGATATGTITVNADASIVLSSAPGTDNLTTCANALMTPVTFTITGTPVIGASITSGALPSGVTGLFNSGTGVFTISGTPTVTGTFDYTITATGGCSSNNISGTITVQSSSITLSAGSASQTLCLSSSLTNIVFTTGGGVTGASISWSAPGAPAGVIYGYSGNTYTISGSPTALGTYSYTITTSGGCAPPNASVNGMIIVNNGTVGGSLVASVSACSGIMGTLNLSGQTGTVQQWDYSTNGGSTWTKVLPNNNTTTLAYNITVPTQFRALVKSGSCNALYSTTAAVNIHNYWTGVKSTNWSVDSNWSDNQAPSGSCAMYIIPVTPNKPQLTTNATVTNLSIASSTSVDLNGHTLTINGTFTGSTTGYLIGSATSGVVIGGNAGSLYFDPNNHVLQTLTVNSSASATLGDSLNITPGDFAPNNFGIVTANGTLNANGNLTLRSGRYGDAIVGNSSGTIAGNVTVERFFPERRAWRFVTAPVNSAQTINAAWQEGVNNSDLIYANNKNPNPGYGTHITYDNNPANGYDYNTTTNPSIKYWDPAADNFVALPSGTNATNVNAYSGYYLFVRGSRAIDLSQGIYAYPYATVLRAKGTLNQTNGSNVIKNLGSLLANQYYLIGNPYASPVNLTHILDASRTTGYKPAMFWVWDPKLAGAFGVGAYVAYTGGIWAPAGGSYQQLDPPVIQSGQAFMVQANINSNISLDFREADKNTSEANVFGKQAKQTHPAIFTNLMVPSSNGLFMADGVATGFGKQFSAEVDQNDAQKLWNIGENIAQVRNEARLAIELRPFPVLSDTLFYKLFLRQQPYTLQIFSQDLPANTLQGWLIDKYLNTKTAVNLYDTTLYNFTPNTDTNSYRNRFMLVFNRTFTATPVPVTKVVNQDDPGTTGNAATIAETGGGVSIYPNPVVTGEKIMLRFSKMIKGRYEVSVSNAAGLALTIATIEHTGGSNTYALQTGAGWAAGSYIVKITGENGYGFTTKLVIGK